jgi:hypothetical protein
MEMTATITQAAALDTLKAQAKNLAQAMAGMGMTLSHAQALEAIAQQYGLPNWDTLSGVLTHPAPRTPRLADMPGEPAAVWVEFGPRSERLAVESCRMDLLPVLHDEQALQALMAARPELFPEGRETLVFEFSNGTHTDDLSVEELAGIRYAEVGMGNWQLADGQTCLRFEYDQVWQPEATPALAIPQMAKSAKGCQLIVLPSCDRGYERYVLVPPRLDAKAIAARLDAELVRLKEQDRALPDGPEYTDTDLAAFVATLGCEWVDDLVKTSETWDY